MKRFKLSPEAARDIRAMWAYLAQDSNCLGNRFVSGHGFQPCRSPVNEERALAPGVWFTPQGLKPDLVCARFGTTKVVP